MCNVSVCPATGRRHAARSSSPMSVRGAACTAVVLYLRSKVASVSIRVLVFLAAARIIVIVIIADLKEDSAN